MFAHLADEEGNIITQGDGPPLNGDYPTGAWGPGELVVDQHSVRFGTGMACPAAGQAEQLDWWVGLYDLATLERLPVYGPDGLRLKADRIELEMG